MKDGFCPRSQSNSGPEQRLSKSPKELSRAPSIAPLPLQEENLPEMGGNLGPCPCPQSLAASSKHECRLCALSYLSGLPSNHFFLGGVCRGSLRARARMTELPQGLLGGWREEGRPRGARDARYSPLLLPPPPPACPPRTIASPQTSAFPAGCCRRARAGTRRGAWARMRAHLGQRLLLVGAQVADSAAHRVSGWGAALAAADGAQTVLCRLSKVPAFCPGLGADNQAPPFKGSETQSRQMRWAEEPQKCPLSPPDVETWAGVKQKCPTQAKAKARGHQKSKKSGF